MKILIMMLYNTSEKTYHPIVYYEHPLPSNPENLIRFKSKGHRTTGFTDREDALNIIKPELIDRLNGYEIIQELDGDLLWDGIDIPANNQLRSIT